MMNKPALERWFFCGANQRIVDCVKDIDLWMLNNKLKLNSGKTEIIVFSSSYRPRPALKNLVIASDTVDLSLIHI